MSKQHMRARGRVIEMKNEPKASGHVPPIAPEQHRCHHCVARLNEAADQGPCDLCLAQRRKIREDNARTEGKPTLQHRPFEALLRRLL